MFTGFSSAGRKLSAAFSVILVLDIIVLALSARVNIFQEFFFIADVFPLALSIITLVLMFFTMLFNFVVYESFIVLAPFQIGLPMLLSIFWLAFNAFSTSRWSGIPMVCDNIPNEYADERVWCKDVQALKAFVWIEWIMLLLTSLLTLRYTLAQHSRGNTYIWSTPLVRYDPRIGNMGGFGRDSEFLQFEKVM